MLFRSGIINCSQEETLGNLLSRLEEEKSESQVGRAIFIFYFLPATRVDFVIKLARATKTLSRSGL